MKALVVTCRDPFRPANSRQAVEVRRRRSIANLAPRTAQPVVCNVNGQWLPRACWKRRVSDKDLVTFVVLPQGGGGGKSNVLQAVLTIVVAIVAWYYAPVLAGSIGGAGWVAPVIQGAIGLVGAALVSALVPASSQPQAAALDASGGLASPSPTYSLSAQGNSARLGQPIPVVYGRHVIYPDFAAMPFAEYGGNEQYVYQLFCLGQGEFDIEAIRIEDTDISSFDEITYEVVPPGAPVTLFPTRVITSVEVSGQEALTGTALGPFTANTAGTAANALAIDIVMPRGLYYATDTGGTSSVSISWKVEARAVDDSGSPAGSWFVLGTETYTAATTTPQRLSYRYAVTEARYEVRLTRLDTKQTDSRYGHELVWAGLRSYLPGAQTYGAVTVVAMRFRATNNLSQQASRKVNMIVTRRLRTWHPVSGWSAGTTATRNPAWAIADICRADYGAGLPDNRIDLAGLYALAQEWDSRGDTFNGIFDRQSTIMESTTQVSRAGRGLPFMQGGILQVVRDAAVALPVAMFTQRNIQKQSLKLEYLMATEETADCIDVSYFDEDVWSQRTVRCTLPTGSNDKPAKVQLFGVTDRAQAWREGMYTIACNRYRRRLLTFGTEMEGFIPALGDLIAVQHDMPRWGQSGEIAAWNAATKTATLTEPLDWSAGGGHKLAFRRRDGSVAGPYNVAAGADLYHAILVDWDSGTDPTPDTGGDRERAHFAFGPSTAQYIRARVLSVRPATRETVEIAAVIESDYVHTADTGAPASASSWQLPARFTSPVVIGLTARSVPNAPEKMVVTWQPAPGAERYYIEQSSGDDVWTRVGEVSATSFLCQAQYGNNTWVRVAGVGMTRGPWAIIAYETVSDYLWTGDSSAFWTGDTNNFWN